MHYDFADRTSVEYSKGIQGFTAGGIRTRIPRSDQSSASDDLCAFGLDDRGVSGCWLSAGPLDCFDGRATGIHGTVWQDGTACDGSDSYHRGGDAVSFRCDCDCQRLTLRNFAGCRAQLVRLVDRGAHRISTRTSREQGFSLGRPTRPIATLVASTSDRTSAISYWSPPDPVARWSCHDVPARCDRSFLASVFVVRGRRNCSQFDPNGVHRGGAGPVGKLDPRSIRSGDAKSSGLTRMASSLTSSNQES